MFQDFRPNLSESERLPLINHLQNFNEELSDALHFFLEALMYSGVDITGFGMKADLIGNYMNSRGGVKFIAHANCQVISDEDLKDPFLSGGRTMHGEFKLHAQVMLWRITYQLQIARNCLKNKPWKQTEMLTDNRLYKTHLVDAFYEFLKAMCYFGHTKESLFTIYFKKNQVNQFRISSKY
jgi:hypothetical protein